MSSLPVVWQIIVITVFVLCAFALYNLYLNAKEQDKKDWRQNSFSRGYHWAKSLSERTDQKLVEKLIVGSSYFDKGAAACLLGVSYEQALNIEFGEK